MKIILNTFFAVTLIILFYSCDNPMELNRAGDTLTGYVTHLDSNLYQNGGFYSLSLFIADSTNPFNRVPLRCDSLNLKRRDIVYETSFDLQGIPSGRYYLASTWSSYPKQPNEVPIVLGILGCDTAVNCSNYEVLLYPNYSGLFRNIISWTDLSKRMN